MSDYDHTVNKNQLVELFGRSIKTIGDWINHGMPVLGTKGRNIISNDTLIFLLLFYFPALEKF